MTTSSIRHAVPRRPMWPTSDDPFIEDGVFNPHYRPPRPACPPSEPQEPKEEPQEPKEEPKEEPQERQYGPSARVFEGVFYTSAVGGAA